jgi:drug/metabolite transporter (DMT)-like permease
MPTESRHGPGYWSMAATFCTIWALGFPISKLIIAICPPETFLGIRFLCSGTILLCWAFWRGYLTAAVPWWSLVSLGLVNFGLSNGFAWGGMATVSAGTATIILSASPVLVGIAGALALADRLSPLRALGLALGLGGVAFVVRNRIVLGGEDSLGTVLVVGSLLCQTAGTVLYKRWSPRLPLTVLVGVQQFAAGGALLLFGLLVEDTSHIGFSRTFWLGLAYMAILNSIVSFQLWFFMLARGSATSVASLQFVMPPLGLLFSWAILGETVSIYDAIGIIPIALGIWLTTRVARVATET